MLTLLYLLPCLMIFADYASGCGPLTECEQPIRSENFFADTRSLMFKIPDEQLWNRVCGKVPALKTCVQNNVASCTSEENIRFANFFKDTMVFICTPVGKPIALNAAKTKCKMDAAFDQWFLQMKHTCETHFYSDALSVAQAKSDNPASSDICPLKATLDTCVKSAMDKKCGPEMATLIERMWQFWMEPVVGLFGCSNSWTTPASQIGRGR